jgi:hypothetical protein
MVRSIASRVTFLLAGVALAVALVSGFLLYGASQTPKGRFAMARHRECGQPVTLRAEDYNRWGGTRDDGIALAQIDFCDPVAVVRSDSRHEVWFWMEVEVTGQVFPFAGWGYPWDDIETPFPGDFREPRNPWWAPLSALRAVPNQTGYTGGDGYVCPHHDMVGRGLDLFFYREEGFQLPVGATHSGWVCLYFDNGNTLPDAFTVSIRPDRARIIQWVDRLFVVRDEGLHDESPMPSIDDGALCEHAHRTHSDTVQAGGACGAAGTCEACE